MLLGGVCYGARCARGRRGELARECEGGGARGAVRGECACGSDGVVRARHRRTTANFKFKIVAQECGQRRMKTAVRECEQRHWTGNTCLHCSSMGESLIVFVKADRNPRILEIVSDSGAKSDPDPQILEIVSDSGAKLDPKLRILEIVSDSGSKSDPKLETPKTESDSGAESDPKPQTPETVSDFGAKSDSKLRTPETVSNSSTK